MDAYRALVAKRDQRAFLPRPVPEDALGRILQAGRMAGSSKNREPNSFIVVRDAERLAALGRLSRFGRWLADAAAVVVLVQTEEHAFDAGRAAQNMMLAAWDEGIASCPNGIADGERLASALGIEPPERAVVVLTFGPPARPRDPARRDAERWSARAPRLPLDALVRRVGSDG